MRLLLCIAREQQRDPASAPRRRESIVAHRQFRWPRSASPVGRSLNENGLPAIDASQSSICKRYSRRICLPEATLRTRVKSTPSLSRPIRPINSLIVSEGRSVPAGRPHTPGNSSSSSGRRTESTLLPLKIITATECLTGINMPNPYQKSGANCRTAKDPESPSSMAGGVCHMRFLAAIEHTLQAEQG